MTENAVKYPNHLRVLIKQTGLTVKEVAEETGIPLRTLFDYCRGDVPIPRKKVEEISTVIGYSAQDIVPPRPPSSLQVVQPPGITYTMSTPLPLLADTEILMKSRRQVLKEALYTACATLTLSPSILVPQDTKERLILITAHPSSIDAEALADLAAITKHYWRLSHDAPIDTLSGIAGHFATITQLLKTSHPTAIYEQLCKLASENALLLGKIFHEIREYDLAWEYYKFSLKVARDTHHTDLWAAGVGRVALLQLYWGQAQQALPLLHEAQKQGLCNQRLHSWLSAIEAEVQAKQGNVDACLRCLDQSKSATLSTSLTDDTYHTGFNLSRTAGYEGSCFVLLRQPELALPALNQASTLCDPTALSRQSAHFADQGNVYAQLGDVQTACSLLLQALDGAEQTKSLVNLQKVYRARRELDPWKGSNEVKNLDERVTDVLGRLTKLKESVH